VSVPSEYKMSPQTLVEFAVERLRAGDVPAALAAFADAIEMDDEFLPAYEGRAKTFRLMGHHVEADVDEAMVAELRPEADAAHRREGQGAGNEFIAVGIAALLLSLFLNVGASVTVALLFAWVGYRRGQHGGAIALAVVIVLRVAVSVF
jgi:hypothetical protein